MLIKQLLKKIHSLRTAYQSIKDKKSKDYEAIKVLTEIETFMVENLDAEDIKYREIYKTK